MKDSKAKKAKAKLNEIICQHCKKVAGWYSVVPVKCRSGEKPFIGWMWKYPDGQLGDEPCATAFIRRPRPTERRDCGRYVRVRVEEIEK